MQSYELILEKRLSVSPTGASNHKTYTEMKHLAWLLLLVVCACSRREDIAPTLYADIRAADRLTLAQMAVSKMATVEDLKLSRAQGVRQTAAALLDAVKIGDRKAAYSYDTYIEAYIDLSEMAPEDVRVDEASKAITITLPAVRTRWAGRDAAMREEHYRVTGLRSNIDASERAKIKEKMNTALRAEVESQPVFREKVTQAARTKATDYFATVAARPGYTVTVNIKD